MRRKKTIRRLPKNTAKLALALRDAELALKRAEKCIAAISEYERWAVQETKIQALNEHRQLEMDDWGIPSDVQVIKKEDGSSEYEIPSSQE